MAVGVGGILGNRGLPMQRRAGGLLSPEDEAARIEALGGLLTPEEPGRKSFFAGTGEFGWGDGLSLLLASAADGMARNSGYEANASDDLFAGRAKTMDRLEKAAERQKQEAMIRARMTQGGLTAAQQDAEIYGYSLPEQPKPPAIGQKLDYFMQNIMPDKDRMAAFKQYQDITSPWRYMGADGAPRQMPSTDMPDFLTDEEWGGSTGNRGGGF